MSIAKTADITHQVIWQKPNSDVEPIAEPALLMREYSDCIELIQDGDSVIINKNKQNVEQIVKALRYAVKRRQE